jgi:hypothetical protein
MVNFDRPLSSCSAFCLSHLVVIQIYFNSSLTIGYSFVDDNAEFKVGNQESANMNNSDPTPAGQSEGNTSPLSTNIRPELPPPPHRSIPLSPSPPLVSGQLDDRNQHQNDEPVPAAGESGDGTTGTSLKQSYPLDPEPHSLTSLHQDTHAEKEIKSQLVTLTLGEEVLDESEGGKLLSV